MPISGETFAYMAYFVNSAYMFLFSNLYGASIGNTENIKLPCAQVLFVRCFVLCYNLRDQKCTKYWNEWYESAILSFLRAVFIQQNKRRRFASGSNGAKKSHYEFIVRFFSCMFSIHLCSGVPAGTGWSVVHDTHFLCKFFSPWSKIRSSQ